MNSNFKYSPDPVPVQPVSGFNQTSTYKIVIGLYLLSSVIGLLSTIPVYFWVKKIFATDTFTNIISRDAAKILPSENVFTLPTPP